jgi:ketosteroid isomerase-like protein
LTAGLGLSILPFMRKLLLIFLVCFAGEVFAAESLSDQEKTVLRICKEWDDAYIKRDAAPLDQLLTADYIGIDDQGAVTSKSDEIALIKNGTYILHSVKDLEPQKVRIYGSTAIVTGLAEVKNTYKGVTSTLKGRATTVLVRGANAKWQIASWHATKVVDE